MVVMLREMIAWPLATESRGNQYKQAEGSRNIDQSKTSVSITTLLFSTSFSYPSSKVLLASQHERQYYSGTASPAGYQLHSNSLQHYYGSCIRFLACCSNSVHDYACTRRFYYSRVRLEENIATQVNLNLGGTSVIPFIAPHTHCLSVSMKYV